MTSHHFNIETTGIAAANAYLADTFAKLTAKGKFGLSLAQPAATNTAEVADINPHTLSNEASQ